MYPAALAFRPLLRLDGGKAALTAVYPAPHNGAEATIVVASFLLERDAMLQQESLPCTCNGGPGVERSPDGRQDLPSAL
jgi:hypothetical protein